MISKTRLGFSGFSQHFQTNPFGDWEFWADLMGILEEIGGEFCRVTLFFWGIPVVFFFGGGIFSETISGWAKTCHVEIPGTESSDCSQLRQ